MLSIIIPTFNERESIISTIKEIKKNIKEIKHEIIVVDDNSPDKTWKIVNNSKLKNVKCIRKKSKRSLSSSVILGFSKAKYEYLLVMDADGQHDPKIIKQMLKKIKSNDFVNASRFMKGGGVQDWSKKRVFMSKFASLMSKPVLSSKITDPMSGFFMTKKKIFNIVKKDLLGKGYKIFLEIIFATEIQKGKVFIEEVPYSFRTRKLGESKINYKVIKEYLYMLIYFGFKKYSRLLKFLLVGFTGVLVNTSILWLLTDKLGIFYIISGIISTESAIISNFLLNNFWTWNHKNKNYSFINRFLLFNIVSVMGLGITVFFLWFFTELGIYYLLSNLIGIAIATVWNYLMNDKITFKIK